MALNPTLIQFFINQIQSANSSTISAIVSQLFEHLNKEVKDNPIFAKYEKEIKKWEGWPDDSSSYSWEMPGNFEGTKVLAYSIYKKIGKSSEDALQLMFEVCSKSNFNESIYEVNKMFIGYFSKAFEEIINANPELEVGSIEKVKGRKVFIIHGHDESLKMEVQLLLTRAGVNNIVLHEQADKGRSIIDKLTEEGKDSNYAIALLSPDDVLLDGKIRARQNVILEVGYFIGQLGKERVRLLIKEEVEVPSDLSGILYEKYDKPGAWKIKLLKEMQAVGIFVDLENVISQI